jgi:hypothetical protein
MYNLLQIFNSKSFFLILAFMPALDLRYEYINQIFSFDITRYYNFILCTIIIS